MKSQKNNKDSTQEIKKSRDFSISFHERRLILIILDLIVINSGFILSLVIRPDYIFSVSLILDHPDWFILLNGLWFFVGYLFQVYDLERAGKPNTAFPNVLGAGLISQIIYNAIPYLTPVLPPSRQPLFLVILIPVGTLSKIFRKDFMMLKRRNSSYYRNRNHVFVADDLNDPW